MRLWLVVPVKSLRDGKSRLAPVLSVAERRAFNEWLLVRTLQQAALFPGLERTLLVSACEEACACASAQGALDDAVAASEVLGEGRRERRGGRHEPNRCTEAEVRAEAHGGPGALR